MAPLKRRIDRRGGCAELRQERPDPLAWLGAAYLMTEEAYVVLGRRGAEEAVRLWPKRGRSLQALCLGFEREYSAQLLRWALARLGRPLRAQAARRALALDQEAGAGLQAGALAPAQREEITRLLAEAGKAPKDPLGIATPWEELRRVRR